MAYCGIQNGILTYVDRLGTSNGQSEWNVPTFENFSTSFETSPPCYDPARFSSAWDIIGEIITANTPISAPQKMHCDSLID